MLSNEALQAPPTTPEELATLVEGASARIKTQDGVDYLDGYVLPPNDDGLWRREPITVTVTDMGKLRPELLRSDPTAACAEVISIHVVQPTITNRQIRDYSIRRIAQGGPPMFGRTDPDTLYRLQPERYKLGVLGRFVRRMLLI